MWNKQFTKVYNKNKNTRMNNYIKSHSQFINHINKKIFVNEEKNLDSSKKNLFETAKSNILL
jgi:hypothetical protein